MTVLCPAVSRTSPGLAGDGASAPGPGPGPVGWVSRPHRAGASSGSATSLPRPEPVRRGWWGGAGAVAALARARRRARSVGWAGSASDRAKNERKIQSIHVGFQHRNGLGFEYNSPTFEYRDLVISSKRCSPSSCSIHSFVSSSLEEDSKRSSHKTQLQHP